MADDRRCPECGFPLPPDVAPGRCPACLLRAGLMDGSMTGPLDGPEVHQVSIGFEPTSAGKVLETLARSIGSIPRILLPDTHAEDRDDPVVDPSSSEMPTAPKRGERYQWFGEIARGGMGAVLKGRDPDLGRELAVKILLESHKDNPDLVRRFVEEAQIGGQLQHPGIVPIYELGTFADHRPFFAMKLVKGRTLSSLLAERSDPARELPRFLGIFESICQTMAYAHARGVIHRDLKPSNVMVGSFGEVQVMDWGLAKVLTRGGTAEDAAAGRIDASETVIATARGDSDSDLSRAGSVIGTPSYMAPEQARGEIDRLDERCDVFALGSILCELLTGQPAFTGRSSGEIQRKASMGNLNDATLRVRASHADPELISLTMSCLAPERDDRLRHAGEVATRVDAYLMGVQERLRQAELARAEEAARAEETTKRARVERHRLRLAVALAASILVLVVLGGGGSFWLYRQRQARLAHVEAVLSRVQSLREQAQARGDDPLPWREAMATAEQAVASIGDFDRTEPGLRLTALRGTIAEEEKHAASDRTLLAELRLIRANRGRQGANPNRAYREAFRRYGLDLATQSLDQAIARLKALAEALRQEVVTFLDDWASVYEISQAGVLNPLALARGLDPEPDRNRLRSFLEKKDLAPDARALLTMAKQPKLVESGPATALLLVAALRKAQDDQTASAVLREAVLRYPADCWLNYELAGVSHGNAECIRYASTARALGATVGLYSDAFVVQRKYHEAEVILREEVKASPTGPYYWSALIDLLKLRGTTEALREVSNEWKAYVREKIKNVAP